MAYCVKAIGLYPYWEKCIHIGVGFDVVLALYQRCFVYNPSMNRSFCYDVLPNGNLKETKQESKFQDLKNYVFSNIQAAEYIERHQQ